MRDVGDLKAHAELFWPQELAQVEADSSIIPKLLDTQEKFIAILYVADSSVTAWHDVLEKTEGMPGNLFLKHLMILSDVSGESLNRVKSQLSTAFENQCMEFTWKGETQRYNFKALNSGRAWNNSGLKVDGKSIASYFRMTDEMVDVAMLLLFGGLSSAPDIPSFLTEKCDIGLLIGKKAELDKFVRQRYILVSRITGGAKANAMGQLAQSYVKERLRALLPDWVFTNKRIPGISQNEGRTDIGFDLIAESRNKSYCAIEVSFQVTTNSTIERKAGQARARQTLLHENGHHIAYVIDGAGNFERHSALTTICQFSDCTVSFGDGELEILAEYLKTIETVEKDQG